MNPPSLPSTVLIGPCPDQWWPQFRQWEDGQTDFDVEDENGNALPYHVEWEMSETGSLYLKLVRE